MKSIYALAILSLASVLTACAGGTPECGSSDAQSMLEDIGNEIVNEYGQSFNKTWNVELTPDVEFEFGSIRTTAHETDTDTFQCLATLTSKSPDGEEYQGDFEYEVYSVEDEDSDFEIRYQESSFKVPLVAAVRRHLEAQYEPIKKQRELQQSVARLEEARSTGHWHGEGLAIGEHRHLGLEIPERTPEQEAKFDPNSNDVASPAWCAADSSFSSPMCREVLAKYGHLIVKPEEAKQLEDVGPPVNAAEPADAAEDAAATE